ncbi:hypothetical protein LCGC14_1500980 [marine sediment metagenome]|uniref:RNA polymerase sigma-70 region 2 domain-containing protein n=1 Tax=marine sediment metagenome TaxID=412755 RepID=A0A0F9JPY3_9ZZZZ
MNAAATDLVRENLPLVKWVLSRFPHTATTMIDYDDLYQEGVLGLIQAAEHFDPSRGAKFSSFAVFRIRGSIIDAIRRDLGKEGSHRARRRAEQLSLDVPIGDEEGSATFVDLLPAADDVEKQVVDELFVRQLLAEPRLTELQRSTLARVQDGKTYKEIAEEDRVTPGAIGNRMKQVRDKLRGRYAYACP